MDIDSESKVKRTDKDNILVKRKNLQALLDDCQRALELLNLASVLKTTKRRKQAREVGRKRRHRAGEKFTLPIEIILKLMNYMISSNPGLNAMTSLKSLSQPRFQRRNILLMIVISGVLEDSSSWDVVSEDDLWDDESMAQREEDYVFVREEDIAEGIACFMATYLTSLKETKDLTPEQLQKALSRMFSLKKRKGKLRKAWDGSKVAYNVASWSATVIGIYQNPVILKVASKAFWASCHVISKIV